MGRKARVVFVGLDAMSWEVAERLSSLSIMPTLLRIAKTGCRAVMHSIPPSTPPGWTTLTTGVNPGKHGLFDFTSLIKVNGKFSTRLNDARDIHYPRLHEMLSMRGRKSVIIDLPPSYPPPKPFNGILVSDWLSPRRFVLPKKFSWLKELLVEKPLHLTGEEFIKGVEASATSKIEVAKELFEIVPWDFFFILFGETDWLFHRALERIMVGKSYVVKTFKHIDRFLYWLVKNRPDNCMIVVASDHGIQNARWMIKPNVILMKMGVLKVRYGHSGEGPKEFVEILHSQRKSIASDSKVLRVPGFLLELATKPGLSRIARLIFSKLARGKRLATTRIIDTARSLAFMPTDYSFGIYVNETLVRPDVLSQRILRTLKRLNTFYRSQLFAILSLRNEVYHGPFVRRAPHIVLVPSDNFSLGKTLFGDEPVESLNTVVHSIEAMLLLIGDGVASGVDLGKVSMCDVAPTILHYLGMEVPYDTDGRVLTMALDGATKPRFTYYKLRWKLARRMGIKDIGR